jgi:hypothetical protein
MKSPYTQWLRVPLSWGFIDRVRATVRESLHGHPEELRESALMVASELAENVIKYGEPVNSEPCGFVTISVEADRVVICTINGVASSERGIEVVRQISRINVAENVEDLYAQRMQEMLHSPADLSSCLGLLRIAYEGNFALTSTYEAPLLTIWATRVL